MFKKVYGQIIMLKIGKKWLKIEKFCNLLCHSEIFNNSIYLLSINDTLFDYDFIVDLNR